MAAPYHFHTIIRLRSMRIAGNGTSVTLELTFDLEGMTQAEAFEEFMSSLSESLERTGISTTASIGEKIEENGREFGRITDIVKDQLVKFSWNAASSWSPDSNVEVLVKFNSSKGALGTKVVISIMGFENLIREQGQSPLEWAVENPVSSIFRAISPVSFAGWLNDKAGRMPTGKKARETYGNPVFHKPMFKGLLHYLNLSENDALLEIGCGGGVFIQEALGSGCTIKAIDHSPDMVNLARKLNEDAIKSGRVEITRSDALNLPFGDLSFTCAASNIVFIFIDQPVKFLKEVYRVLKPGGRLVLFTVSEKSKGTIAAPEPYASLGHYHSSRKLAEMAGEAGFSEVRVESPSLEPFAREAEVPDEVLEFFKGSGEGGQFLIARKSP